MIAALPARPCTADDATTLLAAVLSAYTGLPPTHASLRAAAAAVTALADHGWGTCTWEWDNGALRTVRTAPTFRFLAPR